MLVSGAATNVAKPLEVIAGGKVLVGSFPTDQFVQSTERSRGARFIGVKSVSLSL